jgi:ketosteroid isomerase-like protein
LSRRVIAGALFALGLLAVGVVAWRARDTPDERAIRKRIDTLRAEIKASATGSVGTAARAARIASYFTEDAVVELGDPAFPIKGRDTVMGMVARLQPRTSAFRLDLDDVSIEMVPERAAADVLLTASFVRRSVATGDESRDAREYALVMVQTDGTWRIARITAIDTLR